MLVGVVLCVAGVVLLGAAIVGAFRYPDWNWRFGPARWLGTAGVLLLLGGLINVGISRR